MKFLLEVLAYLGWKVNVEKSDLMPFQDFVHLGMHFLTHLNLVKVKNKRADKIVATILELEIKSETTPREIQSVIGMCQAAEELLPLGLASLWLIQWIAAELLWPPSVNWDFNLPTQPEFPKALQQWNDREWLLQGIPLQVDPPEVTLCMDASLQGWGAHLLPEFRTVQGQW